MSVPVSIMVFLAVCVVARVYCHLQAKYWVSELGKSHGKPAQHTRTLRADGDSDGHSQNLTTDTPAGNVTRIRL